MLGCWWYVATQQLGNPYGGRYSVVVNDADD